MIQSAWRIWIGLALLLAVTSVLWLSASAQRSAMEMFPIGSGKTETVQIGDVMQGDSVTATVCLKNEFERPIRLNPAASTKSCGCTSFLVADEVLDPGEVSEVQIQVQTDGRTGLFREHIALAWKDDLGKQVDTRLTVVGFIVPPLQLEPRTLTIGHDDADLSATARVSVGKFHQKNSIIAESFEPGVTAAVSADQVIVTANESAFRMQAQTAHIRIAVARTSDPDIRDSVLLPVRLESPGMLSVTPSSILLRPAVDGERTLLGRIVVRSPAPGDPERWQIASDSANEQGSLEISNLRVVNSRVTELQIRYSPGSSDDTRLRIPVVLIGVAENGQILRGSFTCHVVDLAPGSSSESEG